MIVVQKVSGCCRWRIFKSGFFFPLEDSGGICFLHAISKLNIHTKHPNTQHATNSQCKIGQWKLWENLQWYRNYNELGTYSMKSVKTSNKFVWVEVLVRKTRELLEMRVYSADRKNECSLEAYWLLFPFCIYWID